jgi:hypothetical protein
MLLRLQVHNDWIIAIMDSRIWSKIILMEGAVVFQLTEG